MTPYTNLKDMKKSDREKLKKKLNDFRVIIQSQRKKMNYTQEQLAEELNVSVAIIQRIEQGTRTPSIPMLCKILWEIGLDLNITENS